MGAYQVCPAVPARLSQRGKRPSIVIGITHPQTCLVLRGRLRALRKAGFHVVLICSPGELLDKIAADEEVEALPIPIERSFAPLADIASLFRIWTALLRIRPVLTEFSTPKAGLLGNLAALLAAVPKRVYLVRGLRLETASGWRRTALAIAERIAVSCAHVVLCNSHSLRRQMAALRLSLADKLRVLGEGSSIGVDTRHFAPAASDLKKQLSISRDAPVIGFVGRLTRDKGIPELVLAFEQIQRHMPEARLLLVGWFDESEDALNAMWRARIDAHPRIIRTGFVQDTAPWYRAMDIMVLPTWREGFPNAVLEAAASGVPVVTTTATGACDTVLPQATGLLVPPGDPDAIAEAVLHLLADPVRRHQMGALARTWVSQYFSRDCVLSRTVGMYQSMVRQHSGAAAPVLVTDGAGAD